MAKIKAQAPPVPIDEDSLKNWRTLNTKLQTINEDECRVLLKVEQRGKKRLSTLLRIYARYSVLRKEREMRELCQ